MKGTLPMRAIPIFIALALFSGCARKEASATATAKPEAQAPAASASSATNVVPLAPQQTQFLTVSGRVLETMDASGYTYMRLETSSGETWAAVNKTKVVKGDMVTVANAASMDGFQSKTLNRTFERIVFGTLAAPGGAAAAAPAPMIADHAPATGVAPASREQMAAQHGQAAGGPDDTLDVSVPKAEGANAKTVAELWAQRAALKGKDVAVKARVVKVTSGVMGKNWLHVRDGSGSKAAKDNDLTVTTDASAKVGDVVTLSGIVTVDKDFGAGYTYPVILENAMLK